MSHDARADELTEREGSQAEQGRAKLEFEKPILVRHDSLPRVTAGIAGGGSP